MSDDAPVIGVTATDARNAHSYVAALERFHATGRVLENEAGRVHALLEDLDGLLVSGGADVEAWRYGGDARKAEAHEPNAARDAFEIAAIAAVRARKMPAFLICRGLQIANVAFGGTLIEDLATAPGRTYAKHDYPRADPYLHDVSLVPGSIASIVGSHRIATNSRHHQALDRVAADLRVVAESDDGVVEAAEAAFDHPFFLGVQWHPENLALDGDVPSARLFVAFVDAARTYRLQRLESISCA